MDPSDITHPTATTATCIDCETTKVFSPTSAVVEDRVVIYTCPDCGHEITLDMDP